MRSEFQKGLSSPQNVRQFLPRADEVVKDFLGSLTCRLNDGIANDMVMELERLNLELTCLMSFGERLNCFSDEEIRENSMTSRLIEAANQSNTNILPTDQGFMLWKFIETKPFKKLRIAQEFMQKFALNVIEKRVDEKGNGNSLLDQYLLNPNINKKDIIGTSLDLLLGGVHTTSFSEGSLLHHISKNQHVQDLMYEEAKKVLPNVDDDITPDILNSKIPYTRAVLKETFRLNPISIGIGRILNHDTILGGYLVPKKVNLLTYQLKYYLIQNYFRQPS